MVRRLSILTLFACLIVILESKKYKLKLISSTLCDHPPEKMDLTTVILETRVLDLDKRTKVVQTNYTVLRTAGPVKISLKIYQLLGSKKIETFKIEKVECQNPMTYQFIRMNNLGLTNDCRVTPGTYVTEQINLQDFAWILGKVAVTVNPGRYEFLLLYYTEKGLAACNSIVCDIKKLKS